MKPNSKLLFSVLFLDFCRGISLGVRTMTGIANNRASSATPYHNSYHEKLKAPITETTIADSAIPSPTPVKCEVLIVIFPKACIDGKIRDVPKIRVNALAIPLVNRITTNQLRS